MSGVITIRSVGGIQDFDSKLRDRINAGRTVGSRGDFRPWQTMAGSLAYEATSLEETAALTLPR